MLTVTKLPKPLEPYKKRNCSCLTCENKIPYSMVVFLQFIKIIK